MTYARIWCFRRIISTQAITWMRRMSSGCWRYIYIYISLDLLSIYANTYITGWWFQTWMLFSIWDVILPIDELIFFKMVKTTNQKILSNASNCQSTSRLNRWQNLRCLRRPLQRHRDAFFLSQWQVWPFISLPASHKILSSPIPSSYCSKEDHPQMASFQQCSLVTGDDSDRFHGNSDQPALTPHTVRCQGPHCLWEERCSLHQAARFFLGQGVRSMCFLWGGI